MVRRIPRTRLLALCARAALVPYLIGLAPIVWLPAGQAGKVTGVVADAARLLEPLGAPFHATYPVLEFLANVALFVPFGLLLAWGWHALRAWHVLLIGVAASGVIELVQFAIPSRFPTLGDVVANGSGALLGAVLAGVVAAAPSSRATAAR